MAKMTKSIAMTTVTNLINDLLGNAEALELLGYTEEQQNKLAECLDPIAKVKAQADKPRSPMAEEKAKEIAEKRKAETAAARAALLATVNPILRKHLTTDVTAKELYEMAKDELPSDFSWHKVQTILIKEMASELVRTERKKGGDTYRLA